MAVAEGMVLTKDLWHPQDYSAESHVG